MTATQTQYYTLQMLIDYAVRTKDDSSRWTISRWCETVRMEQAGTGSRWRAGQTIILAIDVANKLLEAWRKNEWGTPVGALSLRRIIEIAGGPNTKAMVAAAKDAAAKEAAAVNARRARMDATLAARQMIDALDNLVQADPGYVGRALYATQPNVRRMMNELTKEDSACAYAVAYDMFGHPRADD